MTYYLLFSHSADAFVHGNLNRFLDKCKEQVGAGHFLAMTIDYTIVKNTNYNYNYNQGIEEFEYWTFELGSP